MFQYGTYSKEYGTFLSSWASEELHKHAKYEAEKIKGIYNEFPFNAFKVESFECSIQELDEICALARYYYNGTAVYKIKDGSPWMYMVVKEKKV